MQPDCRWQVACVASPLHGVTVPVHVVVPFVQKHPLVHVPEDVYVVHAAGVPEHVPPAPDATHVQPSA